MSAIMVKKKTTHTLPLIGFVGQGYIGKNYADDFEERGFPVIRYALESPFAGNKEIISKCDIVFIAVPTPTTRKGFDSSIVEDAVSLVGKKKIAVIKSTIIPGTTEKIQKKYPHVYVLHSPEFLTEVTAAEDARHPERNIIGIPVENAIYKKKAKEVLDVLPKASFSTIMKAKEAEIVKYANNSWFFTKVVFMNLLYDTVASLDCRFDVVKEAMSHDSRVGKTHLDPIHKSGRGAGGRCFIKDFKAFADLYNKVVNDKRGRVLIEALQDKNLELLIGSKKDLDLISGVYGDEIITAYTKSRPR